MKYLMLIPFLSFGQLVPIDKQEHFVMGSVVAIPSIVTDRTVVHAIIFSTAAGVSKELYDRRNYGTFSQSDLLFTVAGGVFTGLVINKIRKKRKSLHKLNP